MSRNSSPPFIKSSMLLLLTPARWSVTRFLRKYIDKYKHAQRVGVRWPKTSALRLLEESCKSGFFHIFLRSRPGAFSSTTASCQQTLVQREIVLLSECVELSVCSTWNKNNFEK